MNRRDFLKFTPFTVISVVLSSSAVGCSIAAKPAAKVVLTWFIDFTTKVGINVVSKTINDWFASQGEAEKDVISDTNKMMEESGFTQFDGRKVYEKNGVYCYEVGHNDNFNGCCPFYSGLKSANLTIVEGPTVMGLALAAEQLREQKGYDENATADALIPIQQYQRPNQNAFGYNYDQPFVALTNFGSIMVDYYPVNSNTGTIDFILANRQGKEQYAWQFDISFQ